MKKMTFSIFSKILLLLLAIFIALAFYAYKVFQEEKEAIKNKKIIVKVNTPLYHPPLSDKKEQQESSEENNKSKENNESNETLTSLEGAEYISPEEQERRELEDNLSEVLFEEENIIPQDELNNYPIAETLALPPQEERSQEENSPYKEELTHEPIIRQSNNPFLGQRIDSTPPKPKAHPSLGTPIGNSPISPF